MEEYNSSKINFLEASAAKESIHKDDSFDKENKIPKQEILKINAALKDKFEENKRTRIKSFERAKNVRLY